ncbi:hypothetical protein G3A43_08470 [Paraburkholderia aspalathi]|nr:hypothetical protein [Paraburkholderia aspalathi]MBK3780290.1 hypothetical protein [Paraburkholderia aspalathi]
MDTKEDEKILEAGRQLASKLYHWKKPSVDFKPLPGDLHLSTNSDYRDAWRIAVDVTKMMGGPDLSAVADRVQRAREEHAIEVLRDQGLGAAHIRALETVASRECTCNPRIAGFDTRHDGGCPAQQFAEIHRALLKDTYQDFRG